MDRSHLRWQDDDENKPPHTSEAKPAFAWRNVKDGLRRPGGEDNLEYWNLCGERTRRQTS
jgi:hypothetical protein